jgi:hypothetical protein
MSNEEHEERGDREEQARREIAGTRVDPDDQPVAEPPDDRTSQNEDTGGQPTGS